MKMKIYEAFRKNYFLFALVFAVPFVWAVSRCAQRNIQFDQAVRTIRLFKSLGVMERADIAAGKKRAERVFPAYPNMSYGEWYQSKDFVFRIYVSQDNTYFYAATNLSGFSVVYNEWYFEAKDNKLYCIALRNSKQSAGFCRKLGGYNPVPARDVVATILAEPKIERLDAYCVDINNFERLFCQK